MQRTMHMWRLAAAIAGLCATAWGQGPGQAMVNSVGMGLVYIPAGSFGMGSPFDEPGRQEDEFPHQVTLSRPFYMGATEVTQAQWQAVMGRNPSNFQGDDRPVEKVSWRDAAAFCRKLSELEDRTYRLPTEAEWEYACRAGSQARYGGGGRLEDLGWYSDNSGGTTHTVGTRTANAWRLFDMHGNVSEWCGDYYDPDYPEKEVADPVGPDQGTYRVIRGGSWGYFARACRCAARSSAPASYQLVQTGFRVVLEID